MQAAACLSPILRRPLLGLALVYAAGVWAAVMIGGAPPLVMGAAAAALLALSALLTGAVRWREGRPAAAGLFRRARLWRGLDLAAAAALYLAIGAAAWTSAGLRLDDPSPRALSRLMDRPREGLEIEGRVSGDPVARPAWQAGEKLWTFNFRVAAIRRLPDWQPARGAVRVSLRAPPDAGPPRAGERWRLAGVLTDRARFPVTGAAGGTRAAREWINGRYSFRADLSAAQRLPAGRCAALWDFIFRLRRYGARALARGIEHRPEVVGLLRAILLGYRQELPAKLRRDFVATGTYHIFAISGQHVAIISIFIIVLLQAYRVARVHWFLFLAPLLAGFTVMTGLSTSAVRGCLLALFCSLGLLVGRKPDIPSALALAALIILAADPGQLFTPAFLLSFSAVIGLVALCPGFLRPLEPALAADPLRLAAEPESVRLGRRALRWLAFLGAASLAAWLATAPLVARWFNLVAPIALLANLLVIPAASLLLLAGCLSIILGAAAPVLGEIFNFASLAVVTALLWALDLLARLPGGHVYVRAPPLWSLAVWYGSLCCAVRPRLAGWQRQLWVVGPAALLLAWALPDWPGRAALELEVLNTGETATCLVRAPGATWLVDPGSAYQAERVLRRLRRRGVNRLQAVCLTDAGSARAGGLSDLLAAVPVRKLRLPPGAEQARSRIFRSALAPAQERGAPILSTLDDWRAGGPPISAREIRCTTLRDAAGRPAGWVLEAGPTVVLLLEPGWAELPAAVRAQLAGLQPRLLIENRLDGGDEPWLPEIKPAWRVVCMRSQYNEMAAAATETLCLPPGQAAVCTVTADGLHVAPSEPL